MTPPKRYLESALFISAASVAIIAAYLIGSYRTLLICQQDVARSRILWNSGYLSIADRHGDAGAIARIVIETNRAAGQVTNPNPIPLVPFLKLAIFGRPSVTDSILRPYAWSLAEYQSHHPQTPFDDQTLAFIARFPR
jgi:hypothetical protein